MNNKIKDKECDCLLCNSEWMVEKDYKYMIIDFPFATFLKDLDGVRITTCNNNVSFKADGYGYHFSRWYIPNGKEKKYVYIYPDEHQPKYETNFIKGFMNWIKNCDTYGEGINFIDVGNTFIFHRERGVYISLYDIEFSSIRVLNRRKPFGCSFLDKVLSLKMTEYIGVEEDLDKIDSPEKVIRIPCDTLSIIGWDENTRKVDYFNISDEEVLDVLGKSKGGKQ